MNLGFVGAGTIAAAIVRGLGESFAAQATIHLSPRNADVAASLAREFSHVRVARSNQAVLDASEVVILAIRPQVAGEVLGGLRFRPDHHVISLVATVSLETLGTLVAPAIAISKAVPLPAVALGRGATAVFPPDPVAAGLFHRTGSSIEVDDPAIFDALTAATATMAAYFAFTGAISSWLTKKGMPAADSHRYVAAIFEGLAATTAARPDHGFPSLTAEHATPGGLNEQFLDRLAERGVFAGIADGLDAILSRIRR